MPDFCGRAVGEGRGFGLVWCVLFSLWVNGVRAETGPVVVSQPLQRLAQESHGSLPHGLAQRSPSVQAVAIDQAQRVYAGSFGMGIFRSEDRGRTWSAMNAGLGDPFVLALVATPEGMLYAGTFQGGVYRSRDAGKSWQAVNEGLKRLEVKTLLLEGGGLYAGTGDGVYRLREEGDRWGSVATGLTDTLVHALALGSDRTLFAGTSGKGLFRRGLNEPGWTRLTQGLKDHEGLVENFVRALAVGADQSLYAGTFDGGVFLSEDGGRSWRPISRALPNDSIRGIVARENRIFVATGRGIFKTDDRGRQWRPCNVGLTELSVQGLSRSMAGPLYAGTSAGVFRSDNEGESWENVSAGLQQAAP